ncbi:MAG: Uncharacterised protein [Methanobacteriota archaeon]|nr:MAG: Uncharacterised protein [Euryarchaeota archaeon]
MECSEIIPASKASFSSLILQADFIANLDSKGLASSLTFSLVGVSFTNPIQGFNKDEKKESIVPIGASSNKESICSIKPVRLILGSSSSCCFSNNNALILCLNSSAASLVKVIATHSEGSKPPHSSKSICSLLGVLNDPGPCTGLLGDGGSNVVALCTSFSKCSMYLNAITVVFPVPAPAAIATCLSISKPKR